MGEVLLIRTQIYIELGAKTIMYLFNFQAVWACFRKGFISRLIHMYLIIIRHVFYGDKEENKIFCIRQWFCS